MLEQQPVAFRYWKAILLALLVLTLSLVGYTFRQQLHQLERWGYLGLAAMSFLGGATVVLLPVPSLAFTFAMGAVLNPWAVGVIASSAETLGTVTGYLVGANAPRTLDSEAEPSGSPRRFLSRDVQKWADHYGQWAVFAFSAVPNPFLDIVGISAGALRIGFWRFLLACWLGKTVKTLVVAWAGQGMLPTVARLLGQ